MSNRKRPNRPHIATDTVHQEVAGQTPIIPQRNEVIETGRHRVLEARKRVGDRAEREFLAVEFPPELRS